MFKFISSQSNSSENYNEITFHAVQSSNIKKEQKQTVMQLSDYWREDGLGLSEFCNIC